MARPTSAAAPEAAEASPDPEAAEARPTGAGWTRRQRLTGFAIALGGVAIAWATMLTAGIRIYDQDLAINWQLLENGELARDPITSVWYLHIQPPLYNLMVGTVLRWSPAPMGTILVIYVAAFAGIALLLTDLLAKWRVHPAFAGSITALALLNPNLLSTVGVTSYEVPVAFLMVAVIWWFQRALQQRSFAALLGLSVTLTALALTRSLFHPVFVLAVIGVAVVARPRPWRDVALVCAIPIVLIGGWMVKNQMLFGTPTTSSWAGFNLQRGVLAPMDRSDVEAAVADGDVTPLALEYPWGTLDRYDEFSDGCTPSNSHPVVTVEVRRDPGATSVANFNHECYLPLYQESQANAVAMIGREPGRYLRSRVTVVGSSFAMAAIGVDESPFALPGREVPSRTWLDETGDIVLMPIDVSIPMDDWNLPLLIGGNIEYRASLTLALLAAGIGGRAVLAAVRLARAGWPQRAETWSTDELMWLTIGATGVLVILVGDLVEFGENGRFRSMLDPLLVTLPLAGAYRMVAGRRRTAADQPVMR